MCQPAYNLIFMPEGMFYKHILATHKTNKLKHSKTYQTLELQDQIKHIPTKFNMQFYIYKYLNLKETVTEFL